MSATRPSQGRVLQAASGGGAAAKPQALWNHIRFARFVAQTPIGDPEDPEWEDDDPDEEEDDDDDEEDPIQMSRR